MNSTQQSMRRSRASRAKVMVESEDGSVVERISVIIFWTVAEKRGEGVSVRYQREKGRRELL